MTEIFCEAKSCKYNCNNKCTKDVISIEDKTFDNEIEFWSEFVCDTFEES